MNTMEEKIIHFYPYKMFNVGDRQFIYTINASGIFEIDEEVKELFEYSGMQIKKIPYSPEKMELLKMLYDEQVIYFDDKDNGKDNNRNITKISALTLMVVQECNMRCTYCYGDGGEYNKKGKMTFEIAKQAIDFLVKESQEKHLHIAFLGGEPLMNFELIKKVITYCQEIENKETKLFSYTMTTNGTLLNEEIEQFLSDNKVVCQISIDGRQEKHDKNRVFCGGTGSYNVILQKTKKMREKNLVTARATITEDNDDYIEIFDHLEGLGFKAVPIAIAENMVSDENFDGILRNYREYIHYFADLINKKKYEKAKKMVDIMTALEKLEYGSHREEGCGAGRRMYAISIEGDIYPCHRFVGTDNIIGDINTGCISQKFLQNMLQIKNDSCKECWAQNLCLGGCPYENWSALSGDLGVSERNCRLQKMLYEELLKIYVFLTEEDKRILFNRLPQNE